MDALLSPFRHHGDDIHKGVKPVIEGYLMKYPRSKGNQLGGDFATRYFKLYPDAQLVYFIKRDGAMRGVIQLNADFFVSDSYLHPHGIKLSDLDQHNYYLAASDHETKLFWCHTLAGVLRKLATEEVVPPQYQDVFMRPLTPTQTTLTQSLSGSPAVEESNHHQTQIQLKKGEKELADALAQKEKADDHLHALQEEKSTVQKELHTVKLQFKEAQARVTSLEAQVAAARQTESQERQQEIAKVQRAVENELKAKYESVQALLREENASLSKEIQDLQHRLAAAAAVSKPQATPPSSSSAVPPPPPSTRSPPSPSPAPAVEAKAAPSSAASRDPIPSPPPPSASTTSPGRVTSTPPPPPPTASQAAKTTITPTPTAPNATAGLSSVSDNSRVDFANAKQMANVWANKAAQAEQESKSNPFSQSFDANHTTLQKGADGYGRPPPGSLSEQRAIKAQEWVEQEIEKLICVIRSIGTTNTQGQTIVTFRALFLAYQDISDSLVGIMQRAKKRRRITYEGDMCFQGVHDHIIITVLV